MSIAKTTRPHLLTREAAAARIEALETALREVGDTLGYDKNEGKSLAVRESNAHTAWKIARAALAPEHEALRDTAATPADPMDFVNPPPRSVTTHTFTVAQTEAATTQDVRWAVNVLLEKIAAKFEANDTLDIWRSDAAATVRSFKLAPEQEK